MATEIAADDVPPLEDLSDILGQIRTLGYAYSEEKKACVSGDTFHHGDKETMPFNKTKIGLEASDKEQGDNCTTIKASEKKGQHSTTPFCGFQKGFLNKKPPTSQSKGFLPKKEDSDMTKNEEIVRPKQSAEDGLRIADVQEAMKTPSSLLQNTDWLTDDLLMKLKDRPDLLKKLSDPRYSQALTQFSSNPQQAWQRLRGDDELQIFIKEMCGILGDHFTGLAKQENKTEVDEKSTETSKEDKDEMAKILSDPETLNVLKDPWISKLVRNLKENPSEARRMLARCKPEVLPKIKKLVDAGILSFG